jgi:hypothetical protein
MRETGLSLASLSDQERVLTEEDIAQADPSKREELKSHLGQRICSIVSAAMLSSAEQDEAFSPSVPFAATFSASLVLTEFVRYVLTGSVGVHPLYQMSLLIGPETAQLIPDKRHKNCLCEKRHLVDQVRGDRKKAA